MRYVVSLLLVLSGVAAILADLQRRLPACAGGFDAPECVGMQSDWYDVAPPGESWIPIGTAAPLMGAGYALMALAVIGLFRTVVPAWRAWGVGTLCAVPFAVLAATTFASAAAGHTVELAGTTASLHLLAYAWPVALGLLLAGTLASSGLRAGYIVAAAGLLVLASPLVLYVTAALVTGYVSHDTSPWTQAIGGVFTLLAGVALLLAGVRSAPSDDIPVRRPSTHGPLTPWSTIS